jgi:carbonic anhydrase
MCQHCIDFGARRGLSRRTFLSCAGAAGLAIGSGLAVGSKAFAAPPAAPPKPQNVLSPDAALARLVQGNKRYADGRNARHVFDEEREALSKGQNPFAAILSCADSRIVPEYCFDTARGDLFVCRVAGNFADDDIVASFEYAVAVLRTPLIMVLGHQACGAVDATIKSLRSGDTLPGHLPALVTALAPAVKAVKDEPGDVLVNAIKRNVRMNVDKLANATPILEKAVNDKTLCVVGGVYDLRSGQVDFMSMS